MYELGHILTFLVPLMVIVDYKNNVLMHEGWDRGKKRGSEKIGHYGWVGGGA